MKTMYLSWGITTALNADEVLVEKAQKAAKKYGSRYLPRERYNLTEIKEVYDVDYILVLDRNNRLVLGDSDFTWHPGMAMHRIRGYLTGQIDPFLKALAIEQGDHVLDCTLGIGSDALKAAWAVGSEGKVIGLEASPVIAAITDWGLSYQSHNFRWKNLPMEELASRIEVKHYLALEYLKEQPDNSWDIVYFDPMFQAAVKTSAAMNSMRPVACYEKFNKITLDEAIRVCRKRVVLKERKNSELFDELNCPEVISSNNKHATIAYGVWQKD